MKHTYKLGLIFVTLMAVACKNNNVGPDNDLKMYKLQGPVKSISEIDYSNTGKYTTHISFNVNGFIQEQSTYNPDGSLIRKWKYEYNSRNQKVSRSTIILKDSLSEILYYSYDKKDKLAEEKLVNPKMIAKSIVKYEYDANLNEKSKTFLDGNHKIQGGILFTYDDNKNVILELHYDSVYHQNMKQKKLYNPEGLNVEVLYFTMNDSLLRRVTNSYLPNKQLGESCFYYHRNELVTKTTFVYDKNLNITGKVIYTPEDKTTVKHTFIYTYDKHKNWTSRNEFIADEPVDMITRELVYY